MATFGPFFADHGVDAENCELRSETATVAVDGNDYTVFS